MNIFEEVKRAGSLSNYCFSIVIQGFVVTTKISFCYTDHQIFERYHKFFCKKRFMQK